ncbi:double-stranded RNA-binding type zinc finger domain protein [Metarhizium robertsii]|uniref:Transcription factor Zn, C2H2 n=2 Tax=Metarhizium robertsii TaxID=568076 RepID=E9EM84_METRA|nr:transcription factor Zn, C2H2 [Metarhizium robertsii ARSEF 23]EFZ04512.2 transcription factor Zn, C2H2 [Metarhizium robertsii ARSEF 23]EXU95185.1 double-stranded RNA-binding type zinc finger domain protein [Metarhizium robertsii]
MSFDCIACDRSFGSEEALEQHLRGAPVHAPSFECSTCDRSFGSEEALAQHLRDSRAHTQAAETPLDIFFRSFPDFDYNPSLPPATTYAYLRQHEGWRRGDVDSTDAWDRYQDALESELRMWYGSEDDLTAWHALCRAIGINPLPKACKHCEEAVRRTHVNIIDLIEWGRKRGNADHEVRTFETEAELRAYTQRTAKIFRNTWHQEDSNVVMRHLLRKIFRCSL